MPYAACVLHTQVPFSRSVPALLAAAGLSLVWTYLNRRNFAPMYTLDPEYKSKEGIIVSVGCWGVWRGACCTLRGPRMRCSQQRDATASRRRETRVCSGSSKRVRQAGCV